MPIAREGVRTPPLRSQSKVGLAIQKLKFRRNSAARRSKTRNSTAGSTSIQRNVPESTETTDKSISKDDNRNQNQRSYEGIHGNKLDHREEINEKRGHIILQTINERQNQDDSESIPLHSNVFKFFDNLK